MTTTSYNGSRLESLTFLRFIAAIVVVLYHFGKDTTFYSHIPIALRSGPVMVTFFFVLSGFVISTAYYGRSFTSLHFYANRILRIAPVYFIALACTAAMQPSPVTISELALSATFMQSWIPGYPMSINFPGWSISVEAFFYAVSPALLLIASGNNRPSWKSWAISAVLVWVITQSVLSTLLSPDFYKGYKTFSHDLIYYFPVSHLTSFLLGFAGGIAFHQNKHFTTNSAQYYAALFAVSVIAVGVIIQNLSAIQSYLGVKLAFGSSFLSIVFLPFIYLCALGDRCLRKFIALPSMVLLGEASYGIYILQKPVHLALSSAGLTDQLNGDYKFLIYSLSLVVISIISYKLIELPITQSFKTRIRTKAITT